MELRQLGRSGVRVSRLALGTMTWGRDTDEHEAADQLRVYLDAGGNFLDTAAIYGYGDSERVIGGFINTLVKRDEIVIATKGGITFKDGDRLVDNSRSSLLADLDRSLNHLGVDHVDIWQVQNWDSQVPLEETLMALDYAVTSGRTSYVGICNFSGWQTSRAITLQNPLFGKVPITSTQNEYSLLNRDVENEVLDAAQNLNIGFLAWSPLGRGVLTGKYRQGIPADSRAATPHFASHVEPYFTPRAKRIVEAVSVAADGLGYSPLEVALGWVRDAPGVTSAIVGARTGAQMRGILTSEEITIPSQVRLALDDISRR